MTKNSAAPSIHKELSTIHQHLGEPDPLQIEIWRGMTPAQRLDIAFQAYQFMLESVRLTERQRHPDISEIELAWRVTRRMQGDQSLGR